MYINVTPGFCFLYLSEYMSGGNFSRFKAEKLVLLIMIYANKKGTDC